ncbi:efflux RND transporter periplasmic adaptor subunit [Leptothrix ochracea]|uniref:efflux RND transporter periplasmic adaptor subunit n=1 Tax=Leptothrix ochracea TaxID=735331 RepID=UPI0034E2252A
MHTLDVDLTRLARRRNRSIRLATMVLTAASLGSGLAMAAENTLSVPTLTVQAGTSASSFETDGVIQAVRQATVAAQVGGSVVELAVRAGDRVHAGQKLARIDERDTQTGVSRSEAGVAQAQAELNNIQLQTQRTRDLHRQGYISQGALDQAEAQLKAAEASLKGAQASQSQAHLARGFAQVNAPFDGVVLATHLDQGDLAAPGRPILTLYVPGALRAVVQVGASRQEAAKHATQIQLRLPDGRWVAPKSVQSLPGTDPIAQTMEWRLPLTDAGTMQPGQTVRVRFAGAPTPAADRNAARLLIPADALLRRGELSAVYVVREGHFALTAVRTGADQGQAGIEVLAGLKAGERIARDPIRAGLTHAVPAP